MNVIQKTSGLALAMAAASLMGCAGNGYNTASTSAESSVHCYGVNKCGGHNDCKSAENACKGQASCEGKGFVTMPAASCDHLGGTVG